MQNINAEVDTNKSILLSIERCWSMISVLMKDWWKINADDLSVDEGFRLKLRRAMMV